MKVYLLTSGDYSAYTVLGVFSTAEKAEEARPFLCGDDGGEYENELEEFELDGVPDHPPGHMLYSVTISRDGDLLGVPGHIGAGSLTGEYPFTHHLYLRVWARDAEHAVKIAGERRAQLIATGRWPESKA